MSQLFGFSINGAVSKPKGQSPIPPQQDDGVATVAGGYFGHYVDIEGVARNEFDLIRRYRDMALHPEVDSAVDEIVNEAIVSNEDQSAVQIELSNLEVGEGIKNKIRAEFEYIKKLLNFDKKAHEIFRNWYIDGRLYYHKVVDLANPRGGITEVRYIDPLKIKKVKQRLQDREKSSQQLMSKGDGALTADAYDFGEFIEYYLYNPKGFISFAGGPDPMQGGLRFAADSITFAPCGLMDLNKKMNLSYLHKSIKSLNQLRMIEDALVIYRLSRAPERRIFYIDVGNLPKVKAEQYLREVMNRYRNKLVYDASTGEIRDDKKHMSMLEDFWLPRREGGRGTEITTLPGGQNLGELKDVEYFRKKLYNSLNLPPSRLTDDNKGFNLGKTTEVLRDELKFTKFIGRLRKKFAYVFHDMLKTQLVLKGVLTPEDWEDMEENIQYDFLFDNHFSELRDAELMNTRLDLLMKIDPFVGKYYSVEYVRKEVLRQSDVVFDEIDKQMKTDITSGLSPDPVHTNKMNAKALELSAMPPPAPTAPAPKKSSSSSDS
jgi:hypothetical protein